MIQRLRKSQKLIYNTLVSFRSPKLNNVAGLSTTIPLVFKPIMARKNLMPAAIETCRTLGIALSPPSLTGHMEKIMSNTLDISMAPRACCHESPILIMILNVKKALMTMLGT